MTRFLLKAKKIPFELLILIALALFIGGKFPGTYWSFVDDGELIEVSQKITSALNSGSLINFLGSFREPAAGRFRPAYWVYHWAVYLVGGTSHSWHGVIHLLLFTSVILSIYFIARTITGSRRAGFISSIFFSVSTLIQENWYRLGPQELPLSFFLSLSLVFFVFFLKKDLGELPLYIDARRLTKLKFFDHKPHRESFGIEKIKFSSVWAKRFYIISLALLVPAYFTKETSIAFLAFPSLFYIVNFFLPSETQKKLRSKLFYFLVFNCLIATSVLIFTALRYTSNSYASEYILNGSSMWLSFKSYLRAIRISVEPILILTLGSFFLYLIYDIQKSNRISKANIWKIIILSTSFSFLFIQLPWGYSLGRYLLPMMVFLSIFLGFQMNELFIFFETGIVKVKPVPELNIGLAGYFFILFLWFLMALYVWYNLKMTFNYINYVVSVSNNFNKPLVDYIGENAGQGGIVYLNTAEGTALELKQELGLHLNFFSERRDIKIRYFNLITKENFPKRGDIFLNAGEFKGYPRNDYIDKLKLSEPKRIKFTFGDDLYYPPQQFIKQLLTNWTWKIFMGIKINPVLTSWENHFYWEIYKVN